MLVEESRILRLQALVGRSTAGHLRNYVVEDPLGALVWGYFLNDGVGSKPSLTLQLAELRTQRCRNAGWHLDSIRNSRLHSLGRLPGGQPQRLPQRVAHGGARLNRSGASIRQIQHNGGQRRLWHSSKPNRQISL